jgi:LysR family transcriptional regulator, hca operon transcriptional activator
MRAAGAIRVNPVVKSAVKEYAVKSGINLNQKYDAENLSAGMSLAASTGSLMLLPHYVTNMLVPSVVARPLEGEPPTIDLVMGYNKSNTSPLLKRFLLRADELVAGVQRRNAKTEVNGAAPKRAVVKGR